VAGTSNGELISSSSPTEYALRVTSKKPGPRLCSSSASNKTCGQNPRQIVIGLTGPSVLFLTTVRKEKREAFRLRMSSGTYDKAVFKNPTGGCRCPAGHTRGLLPGRKAKGKELMRLMTFLYKFSVSHPKFSPRVTL
jgi:hypothetical protein